MAQVRWMIRRDIDGVMEAEKASYANPWDQDELFALLRQRNVIGMVCEIPVGSDYQVVGFMLYELGKWGITVLNLAVHPKYRRNGYGSALIAKLKSKLGTGDRRFLHIEVDEGSVPALKWLQRHGFVASRVLRGVSDDDGDAIVMSYNQAPVSVTDSVEA
jgi:ribosomal-protein-alanine N-acetyltransferase